MVQRFSITSHWVWHFWLLVMENLIPCNSVMVSNYYITILKYSITISKYSITISKYSITISNFSSTISKCSITISNYSYTISKCSTTISNYSNTRLWYQNIRLRYQITSQWYRNAQLRYQSVQLWFKITQLRHWNTHFGIKLLHYDINVYMYFGRQFLQQNVNLLYGRTPKFILILRRYQISEVCYGSLSINFLSASLLSQIKKMC